MKLEGIDINKQIGEYKRLGVRIPDKIKSKSIEYLQSGLTIAACAGFAKDELEEKELTILKTPLTQTDGKWIWSSLLTYYLEKYSIPLPDVFISHMENNSWTVDKEKAQAIIGLPDLNVK